MEHLATVLKFILLDPFRSRGAIFCLLVLLIYLALPLKIRRLISDRLNLRFDYVAPPLMFFFVGIAFLYLLYPNYLDHVEATLTSLGGVLERKEALYPGGDRYPYNGIVYSPALAEVQWAIRKFDLPIVFSSKVPAFIAFVSSIFILLNLNRSAIARGFLIYLLPFGSMLFWNRSEPFLLFLASLALYLAHQKFGGKFLPLMLGILAGAAAGFKIHGVLYVFAAYLAVVPAVMFSIEALAAFLSATAIVFALFFIPQNVSFLGFVEYLELASKHGISLRTLSANLAFLAVFAVPVLLSFRHRRLNSKLYFSLFVLAGTELVIALLAAKPGAGVHHLIPLIPINAYLIEGATEDGEFPKDGASVRLLFSCMIVLSFVSSLIVISPMVKGWKNYSEAQKEIVQFGSKHSDLVFGVSNGDTYPYVFLNVILNKAQIDYPAFMDLQYAGLSDDALAEKLRTCEIKNLLMPKTGEPFSIKSYYTDHPLFSEQVRMLFAKDFSRSESGKYYDVYTCDLPADRAVRFR
jgi:hypothetical protein